MPHLVTTQDKREIRLVLTWVIVPVALTFLAAIALVRYNGKSVLKLVSDPSAALHTNPLLGLYSNIGIIAWCVGAAISLFAAWLLARNQASRRVVRFHGLAGAFTTLLMVDDFFLIHDGLAPHYLGVSQDAVFAIYGVCFAIFVVACRRELRARNPALFVLAVALLGFMAASDSLGLGRYGVISLAMSGSKLLGIFAWTATFTLAARRDIEAAVVSRVMAPPDAKGSPQAGTTSPSS